MCGRYVTVSSIQAVEQRFNVKAPTPWVSNANVSHGDRAPVVASDKPGEVRLMQFGFTPGWAKKQYRGDARAEGDRKPSTTPSTPGRWASSTSRCLKAIRSQRCLVVADAFIEGPERESCPSASSTPRRAASVRPRRDLGRMVRPDIGRTPPLLRGAGTCFDALTQAIGHRRGVLDPTGNANGSTPRRPSATSPRCSAPGTPTPTPTPSPPPSATHAATVGPAGTGGAADLASSPTKSTDP